MFFLNKHSFYNIFLIYFYLIFCLFYLNIINSYYIYHLDNDLRDVYRIRIYVYIIDLQGAN